MTLTPRPRWTTWIVLLLVPALVAGGVLYGTWHSDARLREVRAAVVNHDEMVEIDGQKMPLGRQLAAAIVDSDRIQNLTWVLADDASAAAGLRTGDYAAVVTIPPEFSAAATSFAKPVEEAAQATVVVETSPVVGLSETAVGQAVAYAAVNSLNDFLTEEYLTRIYLGFGEQKRSMIELADGTRQLADGAGKLATGADASAEGAARLADGADTLAVGTGTWASGATTYAHGVGAYTDGVTRLSGGLHTYADGARSYADGVGQYAGGINSALRPARDAVAALPEWGEWLARIDDWISQAPAHAQRIAAQLTDLLTLVRDFVIRVDGLLGQTGTVASTVAAARDQASALASGSVACPDELDAAACEAYAAGASAAATQMRGALATAADDAAALAGTARELGPIAQRILAALDRAQEAVDSLDEWADGLQRSHATLKASLPAGTPLTRADTLALLDRLVAAGDELTAGGQRLASGADALADGAQELADNSEALTGGAGRLAAGADALAAGSGELAAGTGRLAGGLGNLAGGAHQLADGTGQLADGLAGGVDRIPDYTDDEAATLASVVAAPVDGEALAGVVRPGLAWVSLLLVLALWVGALATVAVVRPSAADALLSRDSDLVLLVRTVGPGVTVVAAQAGLLGVLGAAVLRLPPAASATLVGVLIVAGVAFALTNHALAALVGPGGRIAAVVMALLTAVVAATSAAPAAVGALAALSTLTPALTAVREVGVGLSPVIASLTLLGWAGAAGAAAWVALRRTRTVAVAALLAT